MTPIDTTQFPTPKELAEDARLLYHTDAIRAFQLCLNNDTHKAQQQLSLILNPHILMDVRQAARTLARLAWQSWNDTPEKP